MKQFIIAAALLVIAGCETTGTAAQARKFWALSDTPHEEYAVSVPIEAGLFDCARLENR